MTRQEFVSTLNEWGEQRVPFLFLVDFEMRSPLAFPLNEIDSSNLQFDINGFTNSVHQKITTPRILQKKFISFHDYETRFSMVSERLKYGDSYLTNLTTKTEVTLSNSLLDVFHGAAAKYKLYFRDEFVVFSPECFVKIDNDRIYSYPMKGTIDAAVADAGEVILADKKELAEHVTIVDLIRNDMSRVASNVQVTRFRYLEEIRTRERNLLQVSSEIRGDLPPGHRKRLGDILMALLPAGSVSGAPKEKTLEIIREAEMENRGYYTGVFGYFDGDRLDSGVMIRYIEKSGGRFFYRSGGGITTQSSAGKEYQEIIDKVYVPVA
jgi:para-aminobenzoate synthetase component I